MTMLAGTGLAGETLAFSAGVLTTSHAGDHAVLFAKAFLRLVPTGGVLLAGTAIAAVTCAWMTWRRRRGSVC